LVPSIWHEAAAVQSRAGCSDARYASEAGGRRAARGENRAREGDDDGRIERIRERAYLLWERGHHGDETEHWLKAEREIDAESAPPAKPKTAKKKSAKRKAKAQEPSRAAR
jgi:hypothetical protein